MARATHFAALLLGLCLAPGSILCAAGQLHVSVFDSSGRPVPGAIVTTRSAKQILTKTQTDPAGNAVIETPDRPDFDIVAAKVGFEDAVLKSADAKDPIRLTLDPAAARESVEVKATASAVEAGATEPTHLPAAVVKELPSKPATVSDALPLVPGVVRKPDGAIELSASPEHRSALIVNSADVTDPATGQFGLTVPIDSVETVSVYQTPFLAEYGRFTAGLISVETKRGGEKFKWELNDPFPDFAIRSWHLRGLRDATPRLNFEGPIITNRLFFAEGIEYEVRKTQVHTLPFPFNQRKQTGINSFTQLDWVASAKNLLTGTAHIAPQKLDYATLDFFNPIPTTPDAATHNYTGALSDKWSFSHGLLDNTLSLTQFDARIWGQGNADLVIAPAGRSGNYFAQQDRSAFRFSWAPSFTFRRWAALGTHDFKVGAAVVQSTDNGQVVNHPVDIVDGAGVLTEQITFFGGRPFEVTDTESSYYGQDHWTIAPRLAIDLGVRAESAELSGSFRIAPRGGLVWSPFKNGGPVVRAGFGIFYDRVPLNVYAFSHYPKQILTYYDANGDITAGPYFYGNTLGAVNLHIPFVFRHPTAGDFSPQGANGTIQLEQQISPLVRLRVGYIQDQSRGLVTLVQQAADPETFQGANVLNGNGSSRYRQLEVTGKVKVRKSGELMLSYVHATARGDLNDFNSYLGSFPIAILRPNQFSDLSGSVPNRFLAWGSFQLPDGWRVSPVVEYRTGFPYFSVNAAQQYAGVPNSTRYPPFFSLDSRISKDIKVNPKYTVRLSLSNFNLTNHFNAEAVHFNTGDPAYGYFFGQRGRRFTGDFDVIF
jgi:hypothetical protein